MIARIGPSIQLPKNVLPFLQKQAANLAACTLLPILKSHDFS
jgi:hypothetical protein